MAGAKLCYVELLLTGGVLSVSWRQIRQKQHSDLAIFSSHCHPILKCCIEPNCTDRCRTDSGAGCSPDDFQLYGLPSEILDDCTFAVEALAAGSKDDEKKLIGPRLLRRLGGVPSASATQELHVQDLAKPEGYKLILVFLEKKGHKKDALDKRLLANRPYEAISRGPGQTAQML